MSAEKKRVAKPSLKKNAGEGPYINLSVRLFLTDLGETEIKDRDKIKTISDFTGKESAGVEGDCLFAHTLKEFIIASKINQIELQRVDLVSKKHEITDLTKLIVYALSYRLFPTNLNMIVGRMINLSDFSDKSEEREYFEKNKDRIKKIREDLYVRAKYMEEDSSLSAEKDLKLRIKSIRSILLKMIGMLPLKYFKSLIINQDKYEDIINGTVILLFLYMQRTRISDYLSAAFLEWIQSAEKYNLEHILKTNQSHNELTVDSLKDLLKKDKNNKDILIDLAEKKKISLKINWKFGKSKFGNIKKDEDVAVIKIRLFHKGLIGDWVRKNIEKKIRAGTSGKNISHFYNQENDWDGHSLDFSLNFTSFLKEECDKLNIDLFIQTRENRKKNETVISLSLKINPYQGWTA